MDKGVKMKDLWIEAYEALEEELRREPTEEEITHWISGYMSYYEDQRGE